MLIRSLTSVQLRTLVFTGRPLRVKKNPYIQEWETTRREEQEKLLAAGIVPVQNDIDKASQGDLKVCAFLARVVCVDL